jgi:hypothetical protein
MPDLLSNLQQVKRGVAARRDPDQTATGKDGRLIANGTPWMKADAQARAEMIGAPTANSPGQDQTGSSIRRGRHSIALMRFFSV